MEGDEGADFHLTTYPNRVIGVSYPLTFLFGSV